jgi:8-oxo-dGTP pyrophosphatase MutT (NUDIX family)
MSSELLFVVDENDNPTKPMPRDYVINNNLWRRASSCTIINPRAKQVLCQKRSQQKDERPGFWIADFGGKAKPNEAPEQAMLRELKEELELIVPADDLHFWRKIKSQERHQFEYLFWVNWDGDTSKLKFNDGEVEQVEWFDINAALKNLKDNPKWYSYGFEAEIIEAVL